MFSIFRPQSFPNHETDTDRMNFSLPIIALFYLFFFFTDPYILLQPADHRLKPPWLEGNENFTCQESFNYQDCSADSFRKKAQEKSWNCLKRKGSQKAYQEEPKEDTHRTYIRAPWECHFGSTEQICTDKTLWFQFCEEMGVQIEPIKVSHGWDKSFVIIESRI